MSGPQLRMYSDEESREILRLAGHGRSADGALTRSDLIRAAAEVGVSAEWVVQAEKLIREQQTDAADRQEFRRYRVRSIFSDLLFVAGLVFVLYRTTGDFMIWTFLGVITAAVRSALELLIGQTTASEQKFEEWKIARLAKAAFFSREGDDPFLEVVVAGRKRVKRNDLMDWLIYIRKVEYNKAVEMIDRFAIDHPDVEIVGGPTSSPRPDT